MAKQRMRRKRADRSPVVGCAESDASSGTRSNKHPRHNGDRRGSFSSSLGTDVDRSRLCPPEPLALITTTSDRSFYEQISLPIQACACKHRFISRAAAREHWTAELGDVVCVRHRNGEVRHPFQVPWRPAQIVSIYKVDSKVCLELRWFLRLCELQPQVQRCFPILSGFDKGDCEEEFFETTETIQDVDPIDIIGRVTLLLWHQRDVFEAKHRGESKEPRMKGRCQFMYFPNEARLQPLFCGKTSFVDWHNLIITRGFRCSKIMQKNPSIHKELVYGLTRDIFEIFDVRGGVTKCLDLLLSDGSKLLCRVPLDPQWDKFRSSEFVCEKSHRRGTKWHVVIGDFVAVQMDKQSRKKPTPPFSVPWKPAQVISISQKDEGFVFTVRYAKLRTEINKCTAKGRMGPEHTEGLQGLIVNDMDGCVGGLPHQRLLGPLILLSRDHFEEQISVQCPPFLPYTLMYYVGNLTMDSGGAHEVVAKVRTHWHRIQSALCSSCIQGNDCEIATKILETIEESCEGFNVDGDALSMPRAIVESLEKESTSLEKTQTRQDEDQVRLCLGEYPMYKDQSTERVYYRKIERKPPTETYLQVSNHAPTQSSEDWWEVSVGDLVIVHTAGNINRTVDKMKSSIHAPFNVPWAVAEVVCLWEDMAGAIMAEIRWFYRMKELPDSWRSRKSRKGNRSTSDFDVVETDHVDEVPVDCLLAPARLAHGEGEGKSESCCVDYLGMPVLEFRYRQFWSIKRKAAFCCGLAENRVARGRLYSMHQALFTPQTHPVMNGFKPTEPSGELSWEMEMKRIINNLSLVRTAEEAYTKGATLVGREREHNLILTFLRTAIRGNTMPVDDDVQSATDEGQSVAESGDKHPCSIIIGGPPGTGKTATLMSIKRTLEKEQAQANLPEFQFVGANCMELAHPSDVYGLLGEQLVGVSMKKGPFERTVQVLEQFFTGGSEDNSTKPKVVVLLLDEIDYLITEKQTVLYNLFDWPRRSFENGGGHKLVVVGISNTIDLPDRLKPSVRSRIAKFRCQFSSYSAEAMETILKEKVRSELALFQEGSISLISKKIFSGSGDIRKAFAWCRSAAEFVLKRSRAGESTRRIVSVQDVFDVLKKSHNSLISKAIRGVPPYHALTLVALASLQAGAIKTVNMDDLHTRVGAIAIASGLRELRRSPSWNDMIYILENLAERRFVACSTQRSTAHFYRTSKGGSGGAWPLVNLQVQPWEVRGGLAGTKFGAITEKFIAEDEYGL